MDWTAYLPDAIAVVVAIVLAVGGFVFAGQLATWFRRRGTPPSGVHAVRWGISLIGVALALLVLYVAYGPIPIVSGLTASAIIGIVVTLALQNTLTNFFAGLVLIRDRVLRLEDDVQIGSVRGRVARLGLVTTWLRLEDGTLAVVSNSTLMSGPFLNRSATDRLKGEF